jgi:trimeric autotransporter adhesin
VLRTCLTLTALTAAVLTAATASAAVGLPTQPNDTASANGRVAAIVQVGGTVYLGGSFTSITRKDGTSVSRNRLAAIDTATGDPTSWNPNANGAVRALAASADGTRIFVGGDFTAVGGKGRHKIAVIDATSGAVTAFNPGASSAVRALAVSGSRLYAGGTFNTIGGKSKTGVAKLDAITGAVDAAFSANVDAGVRALAISSDGTRLYIAGSFSKINGSSRPNLARVSASNGTVSSWKPAPGYIVLGIALSGDDSRVYLAGDSTGGHVSAFSTSTTTRLWDRRLDGDANAVAVTGQTVYAGGHFHQAAGATRERLAAFDAATGALDAWNPGANSVNGIYAVAATATQLYVGGEFTVIGGVSQPRFAQFSGTP